MKNITKLALSAAFGLALVFTQTKATSAEADKSFFETDEISFTYADEAFFKKYKTYESFINKDYALKFAVIAKVPVKNFSWETLGFDYETYDKNGSPIYEVTEALYKVDELLPKKPLVVSWIAVGDMSFFSFSYRDKNGQMKYFTGIEGNCCADPEEYKGPAFIIGQVSTAETKGIFTDSRDGKKYNTVKIGKQTWMAENLNYNASSSKCYDNKPANCDKYGRLYDWKTATAKSTCPKGWHLPSNADWSDLMQFINPNCPLIGDCTDAGTKLKATSGWNSDGNGTDKYEFAALPGGVGLSGGNFRDAGNGGLWWSSSGDDTKKAYRLSVDINGTDAHRSSSDKNLLFSVRCIKD